MQREAANYRQLIYPFVGALLTSWVIAVGPPLNIK
jgi:hypothetical protein